MKTKLILGVLLLLPFCNFAQTPTQTIRGTVIDSDTRQPLIGATVAITDLETMIGTVTDFDGNYVLENVPVGRHTLECKYLGYEAAINENIILNSAKELEVNIELKEAVIKTEEVVVTAFRHGNETLNKLATVSGRSFSVDETQRYAASANDPNRMALGFPGVQATRDARNDIIIRGNAGFGFLWRLEDIDIPNPNHLARKGSSGGAITIFSVSMLSNSDFFGGAFPADYGNAFSGVFDIHFRNGNKEKREYTFRAGMLGLDFSTEGPIKKGKSSYLVNYRYSTLGILDAMDIRLVSERESNNWQDLSFKLNFNSDNDKNIYTIWGIGGLSDEFEEAVDGVDNWRTYTDYYTRDFDSDMGAIGASHTWLINNKSYLKTSVAAMGQHITYRNDTLSTEMISATVNDEDYTNSRLSLRTYYSYKFSPKATLKAGVMASQLFYNLQRDLLLEDEVHAFLDDKGNSTLLQPYGTLQFRPNVKWTFNLGLHALYFSFNEAASVEPRLGIQFKMSEKVNWSFGYGLHSRALPVGYYLTRVPESQGGFSQPNQDLELMKSHHLVLGLDYYLAKDFRLRMEGYYQRLLNVPISSDPNSTYSILNDLDGYGTRGLVSEGTGTNLGLDVTLEKFFTSGTFFLLNGSIFESTYEPLNGETYSTRFDTRVMASFMGGKEWKMSEKAILQTGLRLIYGGGGRLTPILSPEADPFNPLHPILDESRAYSVVVSDYFRPDIRIAYRRDNPSSAWVIALDVQNVIGIENTDVLHRKFDPDLGEWVFRDQSGRSAGIKFSGGFLISYLNRRLALPIHLQLQNIRSAIMSGRIKVLSLLTDQAMI